MKEKLLDSIENDKDTLVVDSPGMNIIEEADSGSEGHIAKANSEAEPEEISEAVSETAAPERPANKILYALLMILAPVLGTLTGIFGAVTMGTEHLSDASMAAEDELTVLEMYGWGAEFTGKHAQEMFIGRGLTIIAGLSILVLAALILIAVMSGRSSQDEEGRPALNWFDRIWSEVQLAALATAFGGAVALAMPIANLIRCDNHFGLIDLTKLFKPLVPDQYYYGISNDNVFWYCTAGMAACMFITVVCYASLIKKIKAGQLIERSLVGKILKALGFGAAKAGTEAARAGRSLAAAIRRMSIPADTDRNAVIWLMVKYCILAVLLLTVPTILAAMTNSFGIWLVFTLASIVLACVMLVRKIGKLTEIRAGVIEVKGGNLSYKIPADEDEHGPKTDLDKLASDINLISEATNAAVQNEIKNQRLKTDLISNVSHDLKTPLTSMISYLDILEKEGLDSEDASAHLAIVREKTDRLRVLTEELFEAAKASSGNIPCEIEDIDLSALIDQSLAEMGDRLAGRELDIRKNIRTDNTLVKADGKLLYRVLENLLGNISKYALEKSRVYIDVSKPDSALPGTADNVGKILLEVKNISKDELNISPDELMERFTRGDKARNTEGSGLGLAIAKDLTTLMGGTFDISIDGDMFKVSIVLNEA